MTQPVPRRRLLAPLAAALLPGCSLYHMAVTPTVRVRAIEFHVADGANDNTPIAVDIAYLSANPALNAEVAKMTAEDWFTHKEQLRRDFRDDLDIASWELVPGTVQLRERPEKPKVSSAAFLFARYRAPGPYRYRLTDSETDILVTLESDNFSVTAR